MGSSSISHFDLNFLPLPEPDETHDHQDYQNPPPSVKSSKGVIQEDDSNEKMETGPEEGENKKNEKFSVLVVVAGIISGDGSEPVETSESRNNSGGIEGQSNASATAAGQERVLAAAAAPAERRSSGRVQALLSKYNDSVTTRMMTFNYETFSEGIFFLAIK